MDIQHLVDRLEDLIDEGRHIPFSKYTMIDEERALEIIDQMRISIPEEIEKASRILAQRDRVMAQANEEAARVVQQARQRGESLLDQEVSVQAAHNRAANIIEQGRQEAEAIIAEADSYVLSELARLEQQLVKTLTVVRNGIQEVNRTRASQPDEAAPAQPQPSVPQMVPAPGKEIQFAPRPQVTVDAHGRETRGDEKG
jgi:hypothetical protein